MSTIDIVKTNPPPPKQTATKARFGPPKFPISLMCIDFITPEEFKLLPILKYIPIANSYCNFIFLLHNLLFLTSHLIYEHIVL